MIPGIMSATDMPYSGPRLIMDFENGIYKIGGVSVSAASVIDHPEFIIESGLRLDPASIDQALINIMPDAVAAINFSSGFTMVMDFTQYGTSGSPTVPYTALEFWNGLEDSAGLRIFGIFSSGVKIQPWLKFSDTEDRWFDYSHSIPDGSPRKMAVTVAPDRLSMSLNGGAVTTSTYGTYTAPTFTSWRIGNYDNYDFFDIDALYRSIIFYPQIPDMDLPSYTAIA